MNRLARIFLHLGFALAVGTLALKAFCPIEKGEASLRAGESVDLDGDILVLKQFAVPKYPSGSPRQYVSSVHVVCPNGSGMPEVVNADISVNHPLRHKGRWIYQSSYDAEGEEYTVLSVVKDPYLPIAALGGVLLLAGAFLLVVREAGRGTAVGAAGAARPPYQRAECQEGGTTRGARRSAGVAAPETPRWIVVGKIVLAVALTFLPLFIVGRALLTRELVPALQSPFLVPHVGAYLVAYAFLFFAAFGVGARFVPFAFFLITCGLVLGATWGKICWGDWWQYDPKEMWSLATWLVYAAYFHFRGKPKVERGLLVFGAVMVVLTLTWVNFSRFFTGLHSYV